MEDLPRVAAEGLGQVLIVSPHDDDAAIGCGGLIQALAVPAVVAIVTDGRLGYHDLGARDEIVAVRRREALQSYARLGLPAERVLFLGFPDLSLRPFCCFETEGGRPGAYQALLRALRTWQAQTVLLPNAADFHPDHQAAHDAARVAAVLAGGPLMPDLGPPAPLRAAWTYQVWEPLGRPAARLALAEEAGRRKREALAAFASQGPLLEMLEQRATLSFAEERFERVAL